MDVLEPEQRFSSLSVANLLEARDLYHAHLIHKQNVVGTAIGRYLIRKNEPWPKKVKRRPAKRPGGERNFGNSEMRDYSWPCVLVLVDEWVEEGAFGRKGSRYEAHDLVPKTLYMSDGRSVPVCIVRVERKEAAPTHPRWIWPEQMFGPGVPLVVEAQKVERIASAGCLVSDGHTVYALTNRHVCGPPGEAVYTLARGRRTLIGRSTDRQITRQEFERVYPGYKGRHTWLNLDVGLVEIQDLNDWTSQTYGLGPTGDLADLSESNISLRLIDEEVVAHGAASGYLRGHVKALFHRYRSVGGYEYVADFLIAPDPDHAHNTQPGDSGTVWHLVEKAEDKKTEVYRPLAVEWGGQTIADQSAGDGLNFALATSLSNVCKLLDVELVTEHNLGVAPYWGQMGHYSIGSFACDFVKAGKLRTLMRANRDRVSFGIAGLKPKDIREAIKAAKAAHGFIPLADVPDLVWKTMKGRRPGGRDTKVAGKGRTTGPEHPTHYADIDEKRPKDHKTLRELCMSHPANVSVKFWQDFYTGVGHADPSKRGLLPFRVWQFFDEMVKAARARDAARFVCAAGLVSHYVGDACQPLHGSKLADGYGDRPVKVEHHERDTGKVYYAKSNVGAGVHSAYETNTVDRFAPQIVTGMQRAVKHPPKTPAKVTTGQKAAVAVVALMDRVAKKLPPEQIVKTFIKAGGKKNVAAYTALWTKFGAKTIQALVDGSQVLAMIWDSAWTQGTGNSIASSKLGPIRHETLQRFYEDTGFVPSLDLDHIGTVLK